MRILIAGGLVRIAIRKERLAGGLNGLDGLMMVWSGWMLVSSFLHADPAAALVYRLGLVFDAAGIYFLLRSFCRSIDDVAVLCRITAILLVPLALEMLYEKAVGQNLFYEAVGDPIRLYVRNGNVRAQGPFAHSIIAGTIGATSLPIVIALWHQNRKEAIIGIGACVVMVYTCASSGPILSIVAALGALFMWHHRDRVRFVLWMMVAGYIALELVMKEPAYYIMDRVDLVGGSGGWHRARLIESAFEHFNEWWIGGTDYTRHWMPSGVSWSAEHTDITNHYLKMGVIGGLPLMVLFIGVLTKGFSFVGRTLRGLSEGSRQHQFMCWAFGASLFAHATTFVSVSYWDQSFVFIFLTLAAIGSACSATAMEKGSEINTPRIRDQVAFSKSA
jgi:hypothetical protein